MTQSAINTDRLLWHDLDGNSVFVTEGGGIGINCGGRVVVMPLRDWHHLAKKMSGEFGDLPWWKQWVIMQLLGD